MGSTLPAISGNDLIKLLIKKDGWVAGRYATHGLTLTKRIGGRTLVTFIPAKNDSLPEGTLQAILRQTKLGKVGLSQLLNS